MIRTSIIVFLITMTVFCHVVQSMNHQRTIQDNSWFVNHKNGIIDTLEKYNTLQCSNYAMAGSKLMQQTDYFKGSIKVNVVKSNTIDGSYKGLVVNIHNKNQKGMLKIAKIPKYSCNCSDCSNILDDTQKKQGIPCVVKQTCQDIRAFYAFFRPFVHHKSDQRYVITTQQIQEYIPGQSTFTDTLTLGYLKKHLIVTTEYEDDEDC